MNNTNHSKKGKVRSRMLLGVSLFAMLVLVASACLIPVMDNPVQGASDEDEPLRLVEHRDPASGETSIRSINDLINMGSSGKYIQTADIDLTDTSDPAVAGYLETRGWMIEVTPEVNDSSVTFTIKKSNGIGQDWTDWDGTNYNYVFGKSTGSASGGTLTIEKSKSNYDGSLPEILILTDSSGGTDFIYSIEVPARAEGELEPKQSFHMGNFDSKGFNGSYDGNGYLLFGLEIVSSTSNVGLFTSSSDSISIVNVGRVGGSTVGLDSNVGGILAFGYRDGPAISKCYNTGYVYGDIYVGGIASSARATDCFNDGTVMANQNLGGNTPNDVGGIIGVFYSSKAKVETTGCFNAGAVIGTKTVGGMVGQAYGMNVSNSYNTGHISGNDGIGGIIGNLESGTVLTDCYNAGIVDGLSSKGGMAGWSATDGTLQNCYNIGIIDGGRGAGLVDNKGNILNNCYCLQGTSIDTTGKAQVCTAEQMRVQNTYAKTWDFNNIWTFNDAATLNDGYPILKNNIFSRGYAMDISIVGTGTVIWSMSESTSTGEVTQNTTLRFPFGKVITFEHSVASPNVFLSWTDISWGEINQTLAPSIRSVASSISTGITNINDRSFTANFSTENDTWRLNLELNDGVGTIKYNDLLFDYKNVPDEGVYIPNDTQVGVALTEEPEGKALVYWTGTGNYVTKEFTTPSDNEDKQYTAVFDDSDNVVTLTIEAPVNGNIDVTVDDLIITDPPFDTPFNVSLDHTVELSAKGDDGYAFVYWTSGQLGNTGNSPYSFDLIKDTKIAAVFLSAKEVSALSITATTGGNASYSYTYNKLEVAGRVAEKQNISINVPKSVEVTLDSLPLSGYILSFWAGTIQGMDESLVFTINEDQSVVANFATFNSPKLTLTIDGGVGSIIMDASMTDPDENFHLTVLESNDGTKVTKTLTLPSNLAGTLTAVEGDSNHFSFWHSDTIGGTDKTIDFVMNQTHSTTALFTDGIADKSLKASIIGPGKVNLYIGDYYLLALDGQNEIFFSNDAQMDLLAVETDPSAPFQYWSGTMSSDQKALGVVMDKDHDLTAFFMAPGSLELKVDVPEHDGSVEVYVNGALMSTVTDQPFTTYVPKDMSVKLVPGENFSYWTGSYTGAANPLSFTVDESKMINAYFAADGKPLNINIDGEGSISVTLNNDIKSKFTVSSDDTLPVNMLVESGMPISMTVESGNFSYWSGTYPQIDSLLMFEKSDAAEDVTANFIDGEAVNLTLATSGGDGAVKVYVDTELYLIYSGPGRSIAFESGKVVEVAAEGENGSEFSYWTVNGPVPADFNILNGDNQKINMDKDYSLTSNFISGTDLRTLDLDTVNDGSITLTVNKQTQTIIGKFEGHFENNAEITLAATAGTGKFSYWAVTGNVPTDFDISDNGSQKIVMDADYSISAVFTTADYSTLKLSTNGEDGVINVAIESGSFNTTSYEGYFDKTAVVKLTPVKGASNEFSYWGAVTGSLPAAMAAVSSDAQDVLMDSSYDMIANFTNNSPTLLKLDVTDGLGAVDVKENNKIITTVSTSIEMHTSNTMKLTLEARPLDNNTFSFWSGTTEGIDTTLVVNMSKDQTITAVFFGPNTFELKLSVEGSGNASADVGGHEILLSEFTSSIPIGEGTKVKLTADAEEGSKFADWTDNNGGTTFPQEEQIEITMSADQDITARFVGNDSYNLFITIVNQGSVSWSLNGGRAENYMSGTTVLVDSGDKVTLTATPDSSSEFSFWTGTYSSLGKEINFTMDRDHRLTALFTNGAYNTLSPSTDANGTIGLTVGADSTPDAETYPFTYTSDMTEAINITSGAEVKVNAKPISDDAKFSYWSGTTKPEGFSIGLANQAFKMNGDYDISAHFTTDYKELKLGVSGDGRVDLTINGGSFSVLESDGGYTGYFDTATEVSLSASKTGTNNVFSYWNITGAKPEAFDILQSADQKVILNDNYNMAAVFTDETFFTLDLTTLGAGTITLGLGGESITIPADSTNAFTLNAGTKVNITAANSGTNQFSYWKPTGDPPAGLDAFKNDKQTIEMDKDYTLTAVFTAEDYNTLSLATNGDGIITLKVGEMVHTVHSNGDKFIGYFDDGVSIDLAASSTDPIKFSYWSSTAAPDGFDAFTEDQTITMSGDYDLTANFTSNKSFLLDMKIVGEGQIDIKIKSTSIGTITSDEAIHLSDGTQVSLEASPVGTDNAFSFWDGTVESLNKKIDISMTKDYQETAVFTTGAGKLLTLGVNDTKLGTITSTITIDTSTYELKLLGSTYLTEGASVSLNASTLDGGIFSFWSKDVQSIDNPLALEMTQDYSVIANFTNGLNDVTLKVNFIGSGKVTLDITNAPDFDPYELKSGEEIHLSYGTPIELTPETTGTNNHFSYWSDGTAIFVNSPLTLTMNKSYSLDANFTSGTNDRELTLDTDGVGVIQLGIDAFQPIDITKDTVWLEDNTSVNVTPKATGTKNTFSYWAAADKKPTDFKIESGETQTFNMADSYGLTAYFTTSGGDWTLTLNVDDVDGGDGKITVTAGGKASFDVTETYTGKFNGGTEITLSASGTTSKFSNWNLNSTDAPIVSPVKSSITFNMDASYDLTAGFFTGTGLKLDISVDGNGSVLFTIGGLLQRTNSQVSAELKQGTAVDIYTEDSSEKFSNWEIGGSIPANFDVMKGDAQAFTMESDYALKALFDKSTNMKTLTVDKVGNGSVAVTIGNGTVSIVSDTQTWTLSPKATISLNGVADSDSYLLHWKLDGSPKATDNPWAFTLSKDCTVTAVFTLSNGTGVWTIDIGSDEKGTVKWNYGDMTGTEGTTVKVLKGDSITLVGTPKDKQNDKFLHWRIDDQPANEEPTWNLTPEKDCKVTGVFVDKDSGSYMVDIESQGNGTAGWEYGLMSGNKFVEVKAGDSVKLTATSNDENTDKLLHWEVNNAAAEKENPWNFTPSYDCAVKAVFVKTDGSETWTVNVTTDGTGDVSWEYGDMKGTGTVEILKGDSMHLYATSSDDQYKFLHWRVNDVVCYLSGTWEYFTPDKNCDATAHFVNVNGDDTYVVTLANSGPGTSKWTYGVVSGTDPLEVKNGDTITLEATPNETDSVFAYWKVGDEVKDAEALWNNFTSDEDCTVTALFAGNDNTYTVTVGITGPGSVNWSSYTDDGTITGTETATVKVIKGDYFHLESVISDTNYKFLHWRTDGVPSSTDEHWHFTPTADCTVTAMFVKADGTETHTITLDADGKGTADWQYGNIEGSGGTVEVLSGDSVNLTGTPADADNKFLHWKLDDVVTNMVSPWDFKPEKDCKVTGVFVNIDGSESHVVTLNAEGSGTAKWTYGVVSGTDPVEVKAGDEITLEGTPADADNKFLHWKVDDAVANKDNPWDLTPSDDCTVTGVFVKSDGSETWSVEVGSEGSGEASWAYGTMTGTGTVEVIKGDELTLTATPADADNKFLHWKVDEKVTDTTSPMDFTPVADCKVTAMFVKADGSETYIITFGNDGNGTADWQYGNMKGNGGTVEVLKDDTVSITGTPAADSKFLHWKVDSIVENMAPSWEFKATKNCEVTAVFALNDGTESNTVTLTVDGSGKASWKYGNVDGTDPIEVKNDDTISLTATPDEGNTFIGWSIGTQEKGTESPWDFKPTEDSTVKATFAAEGDVFTITLENDGPGTTDWSYNGKTGTDGTITVVRGGSVELTPKAADTDNKFLHWKLDGTVNNDDNPWTFTPEGSCTVTAVFVKTDGSESNTVTIDTVGQGTTSWKYGDMEGTTNTVELEMGDSVDLTGTPSTDYRFLHWKLDGTVNNSNSTWTFAPDKDCTATAVFVKADGSESYVITLSNDGNGTTDWQYGGMSGSGGTVEVLKGDAVSLTGTPAADNKFLHWKLDGIVEKLESSWDFTATNNCEVTAVFALNDGSESHIVTLAKDGNGTVGWKYGNISGTDPIEVKDKDLITLTATADTDNTFINWEIETQNMGKDNPWDFIPTEDCTVTGFFASNGDIFTITLENDGPGAIDWAYNGDTGTGGTIDVVKGNSIELTPKATDETSYKFLHWKLDGTVNNGDSTWTFTPESSCTVTAVFVKTDGSETNTVTIDTVGQGTTSWKYGDWEETTNTVEVKIGDSVELTGTPSTDYKFLHWKLDGAVNNSNSTWTFTPENDCTATAVFVKADGSESYVITLSNDGNGTTDWQYGGMSGSGGTVEVLKGDVISLTGTPSADSKFLHWKLDGIVENMTSPWDFTATKNCEITAVFALNDGTESHIVTLDKDGNGTVGWKYGNVEGSDPIEVKDKESVSLIATADTDNRFISWKIETEEKGTDNPWDFVPTEDCTVTGFFASNGDIFTITLESDGPGEIDWSYNGKTGTGGTIEVIRGNDITLTPKATDETSYKFLHWKLDGTVNNDSNPWTFTPEGSCTVTAVFVKTDGSESNTVTIDTVGQGTTSWKYGDWEETTSTVEVKTGDSVDLTGTPSTDYKFLHWKLDGTVNNSNSTWTFAPENDCTTTAVFVKADGSESYVITLSNDGNGTADWQYGGMNSSGGTVEVLKGDAVSLTGTPATDNKFLHWKLDGTVENLAQSWDFTATKNCEVTAVFALNDGSESNVVTLANEGPGTTAWKYGNVDGTDPIEVKNGDTLALNGTPKTDSSFIDWKIDAVEKSTDNPWDFVPTEDCTVTGVFAANGDIFTITLENDGPGTTDWSYDGNNGTDGTVDVVRGNSVVLTPKATDETNYKFLHWELDGTVNNDSNPWTFTPESSCTITAVFVKGDGSETNTVTIDAVGQGTTSWKYGDMEGTTNTVELEIGDSVDLSGTPSTDYKFLHWKLDGTVNNSNSTWTFAPDKDCTATAVFVKADGSETYAVTLATSGSGTAKWQYGSMEGTGSVEVIPTESIILTGTPDNGSKFLHWNVDDAVTEDETPWTFTPEGSCTVTAVFVKADGSESYVITLNNDGNGTADWKYGGMSGSGGTVEVLKGDAVSLTGTPASDSKFLHWKLDGVVENMEPSWDFTATKNCEVTAVFALNDGSESHIVTLAKDGNGTVGWKYGNVNGTDAVEVKNDDTISLIATADTDNTFVGWEIEAQNMGKDNPWDFTPTEDCTVTGMFASNGDIFTITLENDGPGEIGWSYNGKTGTGGTIDVVKGKSIELTPKATDETNYKFLHWELDGTVNNNSDPWTFTPENSCTVTAVFVNIDGSETYTVSIDTVGQGATSWKYGDWEETTNTVEVKIGDSVDLTGTASADYKFLHWKLDGAINNSNSTWTFTPENDCTTTAVFVKADGSESYVITLSNDGNGTTDWQYGGMSGSGGTVEVLKGDVISLTGTPAADSKFLHWKLDGIVEKLESSWDFTATNNCEVTAVFALNDGSESNVVTLANEGPGTTSWKYGNVDGTDPIEVKNGDTLALNGTPNTDSSFVNWKIETEKKSTDNPWDFVPTEDCTVTGVFAANGDIFTITLENDGPGTIEWSYEGKTGTGGTVDVVRGNDLALTPKATDETNYKFLHWELDGTVNNGDSTWTFTPESSCTVTAVFVKTDGSETNTVTIDTVGQGTTSWKYGDWEETINTVEVKIGDSVELTGTPSTDYKFLHWKLDNAVTEDESTWTLTPEDDCTATAVFVKADGSETYNVTLATSGSGTAKWQYGSMEGTGSVEVIPTESIILTGTPDNDSKFLHWKLDGAINNSNSAWTFTPENDCTATAVFVKADGSESYVITLSNDGNGTVDWQYGGISGSGGTVEVLKGDVVSLTGAPASDSKFLHWKLDGVVESMTTPWDITATKNCEVTAVFALNDGTESNIVTLTVDGSGSAEWKYGNVTGTEPVEVKNDDTLTLNATADEDNTFTQWMIDTQNKGKENPWDLVPTEDCTVTAVFTGKGDIFTITLENDGPGEIAWSYNGDTGIGGSVDVVRGKDVVLTPKATDEMNYKFLHWELDGTVNNDDNPWTFTPENSCTITAVFVKTDGSDTNTVTIDTVGQGTTSWKYGDWEETTSTVEVKIGDSVDLSGTPADDYKFLHWKLDGTVNNSNSTWTFAPENDCTVTAVFVKTDGSESYVITLGNDGNGTADWQYGGMSGSGGTVEVLKGDAVSLTGTPAADSKFLHWKLDGVVENMEPSWDFTATNNCEITAVFALNDGSESNVVTLANEGPGTTAWKYGNVDGTDPIEVKNGDTLTLNGTPNTDSSFVSWKIETEEKSNDNPWDFTPTEDCTVTGVFVANGDMFTITLESDGPGTTDWSYNGKTGTDGTITVVRGGSVELTPKAADTDNKFLHWKLDGTVNNDSNPWTFTPESSCMVTAVFVKTDGSETNTVTIDTVGQGTTSWKYGDMEGTTNTVELEIGDSVDLSGTPSTDYKFLHWKLDGAVNNSNSTWTLTPEDDCTATAVFVKTDGSESYVITLSNDGNGAVDWQYGGMNGSGGTVEVLKGDVISLTGTPAADNKFLHWKLDGVVENMTSPWDFTATKNCEVTAVFVLSDGSESNVVTLTTDGSGSAEWKYGNVTGTDPVEVKNNDTLILSAVADVDNTFTQWKVNDQNKGKETPWNFVPTEDCTVTAVFTGAGDIFTITLESDGPGAIDWAYNGDTGTGGTIDVVKGNSIELTPKATDETSYKFLHWKLDGTVNNGDSTWTFTPESSCTVTAVFVKTDGSETNTVTIDTVGQGTTSWKYGDWEETTNTVEVKIGDSVDLSGTPADDYKFLHWKLDGTVNNSNSTWTFTPENDCTATAVFVKADGSESYVITLSNDGNGAADWQYGGMSGSGGTVEVLKGDVVSLTGTPASDSKFLHWKLDGTVENLAQSWDFTATKNCEVTAVFALNDGSESNVVTLANEGPGTTSWKYGNVTGTDPIEVKNNDVLSLIGTPSADSKLVNWKIGTEKKGSENPWDLTPTEDCTVTGVFAANGDVFTITFANDGPGKVSWSHDGKTGEGGTIDIIKGETVTITGTSDDSDNKFLHWKVDGTVTGAENPWNFEPESSCTVTGVFVDKNGNDTWTVNVGKEGNGDATWTYGTMTDTGTVEVVRGESVTLTATPADADNKFLLWKVNDSASSNESSWLFTPSENSNVVAYFVKTNGDDTYTITLTNDGDGTSKWTYDNMTGTGTVEVLIGDDVILEGTPNVGSHFLHWKLDDVATTDGNPWTLTPEKDCTAEAVFATDDGNESNTVTIETEGPGTASWTYGTMIGTDPIEVKNGDSIISNATPEQDSSFVNWRSGTDIKSTENPWTFTPDSDITLTAVFIGNGDIFTVTLENDGPGTIDWSYNGDSGTGGTVKVNKGGSVELTPTADAGKKFLHWEVDGRVNNGDDPWTFTPDRSCTVTAVFVDVNGSETHTVTLATEGNGTTSWKYDDWEGTTSAVEVMIGDTVTLTGTPDDNDHKFLLWKLDGVVNNTDNPWDLMPEKDCTATAVFVKTDGSETFTINLDSEGRGTIDWKYGDMTGTGGTVEMIPGDSIELTAVPDSNSTFLHWNVDGSESSTDNPWSLTPDKDCEITAVFESAEPPMKNYYITATSDQGSTISPSGTLEVVRGDNKTFRFSAADGYVIDDVSIDGVSHPELILKGEYTFTNVMMNHTISVTSETDHGQFWLDIDITEGNGHVDYSIDGEPLHTYYGPVMVEVGDDIVMDAVSDDGYHFKEWSGEIQSKEVEIEVVIDDHSVHFDAAFEEDGGAPASIPWGLILVALVALFLLILLIIIFVRSYEVIKIPPEGVIDGKDKARRKKDYTFKVNGVHGIVSYRIGEDGEWKPLMPDAEGDYVIPGAEVVDKITIDAE